MIIVKLNGGLGNQLFQYALGRRLAHERGAPLRFDLSALQSTWSYRQYKLSHFNVEGQPALKEELQQFNGIRNICLLSKLDTLYQSCLPYYRRRVIRERAPTFDPHILYVRGDICLEGYWQSEKYFCSIRPMLLQELQINEPIDSANHRMLEEIQSTNSVSLHIRRGDYVTESTINTYHGVLPLSYYLQAMRLMESKIESLRYFVFSDDMSWAKEHLNTDHNIVFVDQNGLAYDYFDFTLMTACKHHIIANSSFSWWAAWLSNQPQKQVIGPRNWYQSNHDTRDLIPRDWIVI